MAEETEQEKNERIRSGKFREFEERIKAIETRQSKLIRSFEEFKEKYD